jgi:hypothetical protein
LSKPKNIDRDRDQPIVHRPMKLSRDGIPIDAKDWTAADWQDLHNAIERAKNAIRKRHGAASDAKSTAHNE